jgi:hypothetical protein
MTWMLYYQSKYDVYLRTCSQVKFMSLKNVTTKMIFSMLHKKKLPSLEEAKTFHIAPGLLEASSTKG